MKLKDAPWKKSYDQCRQHIKKQRHFFANKTPSCQSYGFSSSQVWMWELDYKESWAQKNWCFWTVVLKKTVESPLDCKEIQPVLPKGGQSWIFTERIDAETETPIIWPPDAKNWLTGKDPDVGKDWRQEQKGTTEDEMVGWPHWLDGRVWVSSVSWWWTGRPGVLQSLGSQRVRHDWATELILIHSPVPGNQTTTQDLMWKVCVMAEDPELRQGKERAEEESRQSTSRSSIITEEK